MSNAHARRRRDSVSASPKRRIIERAAQYVVEQLEQRTMLTSVVGGPIVDTGVAYNLGLSPNPWAPATSYRVNWGADQGTSAAAGNADAFPAKVFTQSGVYRPIVQSLDASGNAIAGSDAPLAFDPTFGDRGRVFTSFKREDIGAYYSDAAPDTLIEQVDGKILIGGLSGMPNGRTEYLVARYRPDGSLDNSFGAGGKLTASFYPGDTGTAATASEARKLALQRDGKILVAGSVSNGTDGHGTDMAIARYNPDGTLDQTFGNGGVVILDLTAAGGTYSDDIAYDVTVQPDGKILLAGSTKISGSNSNFAVVRLSTYGELDPTFGTGGVQRIDFDGGEDVACGVALTAEGKILVGGGVGWGYFGLSRLNANGSIDDTFDGNANANGKVKVQFLWAQTPSSMFVQADGRITLTGRLFLDSGGNDYGIARFNPNGTLDTTLNPLGAVDGRGTLAAGTLLLQLANGNNIPLAVHVQDDGKIIVAGCITRDGVNLGGIYRLNESGSRDATFGINGELFTDTFWVAGVGVQADGKILATAFYVGGASLLRLQPDNTLTVVPAVANGTVTISPHAGSQALGQVTEHVPFLIDLDAGTTTPDSWMVDWGDGQVQTYSGGATTAVHVFSGAPNTYLVTATAIDGGDHHASNTLRVTVGLDRPLANDEQILDDGTPAGATLGNWYNDYEWSGSDPAPFRGSQSLVTPVISGLGHAWVQDLPNPKTVNAGDILYGYVWLDPAHPPQTVAMRWEDADGSWQHGAYWGQNTIPAYWPLTEGTAELWQMGKLPATGGWARLEVRAEQVGMVGKSIHAVDMVVYGGRAAFDDIGINRKPVGPAAATGLVAIPQTGSQVRLEWRPGGGQETYRIMHSLDGVNYSPLAVVPGSATSFVDNTVAPGTKYWYRVDAYSSELFTRSLVTSTTTPLTTTDVTHGLWAKYYNNETFSGAAVSSFERSADLNWGSSAPVGGVGQNHFSVELTGRISPVHASGSQSYTFWVSALTGTQLWVNGVLLIDHAADSPYAGDANHDGVVDFNDLAVLSQHYNDSSRQWTWEDGDFNGDGAVDFLDLAKLSQNYNTTEQPTRYPDANPTSATIDLQAGQSYDIKLRLIDSHDFASAQLLWKTPLMAAGAAAQIVPLAQLTPSYVTSSDAPIAPSDLTAAVMGSDRIDLHWTDQSAYEQGFRIERKTGVNGTYAQIVMVGANVTSYSDTGRAAGVTYYYRVKAYNARGESAYSLPASATIIPAVASGLAANDLTATAATDGTVTLRWLDDANGEDGFTVLRSTQPDQNFAEIHNLEAGQTRYTDDSAQSNTTYYYRVVPHGNGADGQPSNTASATTAIAGSQSWTQVDTVNVPVNGSAVTSHLVLLAGVHYQLRASGNFHLGGWENGKADAEYADFVYHYDLHPTRGVDYGIAIDDPSLDSNKYPFWGDYSSSHTYAIDFVGNGTSINLNYHDDNYGDNLLDAGSMTLQIWQSSPGPTGSVSGLVWLDTNRNARLDVDASGPLESGSGGHRVYADLNKDGQWESNEPFDVSEADGSYGISGLPAGPNVLRVVPASGYWVMSPRYGVGRSIDIADGQTFDHVDFGVATNHAPTMGALSSDPIYLDPYAPVARHPKVIWTKGDLLVSTFPDKLLQQYHPDGTYVQARPEAVNGNMQFDANGDLIAVDYDTQGARLLRYSGIDGSAKLIADDLFGPTAVEADVFDNVYVATRGWDYEHVWNSGGIHKYDREGNKTGHWLDDTWIDAFDLMADQHTILYASDLTDGGTIIHAFDLNTGDSHNFATGLDDVLGIRVCPDNRVLVTDKSDVRLYDALGNLLRTYDTPGENQWFAANADPDGLSFWAADAYNPTNGSLPEWERGSGELVRFDLATGAVLAVVDGLATIDKKIWKPDVYPGRGPRSAAIYGGATAASPTAVGQDFVYRVPASDPDGDPITFELVGDAHGATIDSGTGVLQWTPTTAGTFTFTVRVTDSLGASTQQPLDVHVLPFVGGDNHAPLIQTTDLSDAGVGNPYQNRVLATDPDGDRFAYSVVDSPGVRIDRDTGVLAWVPTPADQTRGYKLITVRVIDARSATTQRTFRIGVRPAPIDASPVAIKPQDGLWQFQVGQTSSFTIETTNGAGATFFGISLLPGMRLSRTKSEWNFFYQTTLTWTPTASQVGRHVIRIGAGDAQNGTEAEQVFTLDVEPAAPVDDGAPVIVSPLWISAVTGQEFSGLLATFTDPSPTTRAFRVAIDWGDGDESPATLSRRNDGVYEVRGTHTYTLRGLSTHAVVKIYETHDGNPEVLRASTPLDVDVSESSLPTPTGVVVTALSQTVVQIRWNPVRGADGYVVRRTNPDGTVDDLPGPTDMTESPYYDQDERLTPGTRYGYQVIASDVHRTFSVPSPIIYVTTNPNTVPDKAGNLTAKAVSLTAIRLAWTGAHNNTIQGWDVLRAGSADGTYASILPPGQVVIDGEYVDTGLELNKHYWYKVVSVGSGPGAPRSEPSAPADAATTLATKPTNLVGGYAGYFADSNARRIGLKWDAVDGVGILGYDIYRGTTDNFALNASTLIGSSADPRYTDDIVGDPTLTNKIYYYAVRAVYAGIDGGETSSDPSQRTTVDARNVNADMAPTAPSDLRLVEKAPDHVTIAWSDNSVNEAGFDIYRVDAGTSALVGRVTADAVTFTDTLVQADSTYDYRVVAYNHPYDNAAAATSAPFHVVVSGGTAPAAPTNLSSDTAVTNYERIGLTWNAPSDPTVVGYYVYGKVHLPDNHDVYVRLTPERITATSFVVNELTAGTTYGYQVTAVSATGAQSAPLVGSLWTVGAPTNPALPPIARITSPLPFDGINVDFTAGTTNDTRIRKLTAVKIIVDDVNPSNAPSWTLKLRRFGPDGHEVSGEDIVLASGTGRQGSRFDDDGVAVYNLDPSLYANGQYKLILTASDAAGDAVPQETTVSLFSNAKLGNLVLPVTDLQFTPPGGTPIIARRVYDSSRANERSDFGFGWRLETSDVILHTTATNAGTDGGPTLRQGDVVYIDLPDGQHAFQFLPVPNNYTTAQPTGLDPYGALSGYDLYWAQFVAVDGSDATLTVPGDIHDAFADRVDLQYDRVNGEFHAATERGEVGYDPSKFGGHYVVRTRDGSSYQVDANTGQMTSQTDSAGVTTEYAQGAISSDDFDTRRQDTITQGGYTLKILYNRNDGSIGAGLINSIDLVDANDNSVPGKRVSFQYNNDGTLREVDRSDGTNPTTYGYTTSGQPHLLDQVINPQHVVTLRATYDDAGRVAVLKDARGNDVNAGVGTSDGSKGSEVVADPVAGGETTENIYDDHGNVIRQIRTIHNAAGVLTGYQVTVSEYDVSNVGIADELTEVFNPAPSGQKQAGTSSQNTITAIRQYAPFVVLVANADDRYTQLPTQPLSETTFATGTGPGSRLPSQQIAYLGTGARRLTEYTGYQHGKPSAVTTTLQTSSDGGQTWQDHLTYRVDYTYDSAGRVILQSDSLNGATKYVYTPTGGDVPAGLLADSYRVSATGTILAHLVHNEYYTDTNVAQGRYAGMLMLTHSGDDAAARTTHYAYDARGRVTRTYYLWDDPAPGADSVWVVDGTQYEDTGNGTTKVTTTRTLYRDSGTAGVLDLDATETEGASGNLKIAELRVNPSITSNPDDPDVKTSVTVYDALGRPTTTTDEHGTSTMTDYDLNGQAFRVTVAGGTQTRTVYDRLGRVEWQTEPFYETTSNNFANGTHNIYDSLGRVIRTEHYANVAIDVVRIDPDTYAHDWNAPAFDEAVLAADDADHPRTLLSAEETVYDDQGRVVETDRFAGNSATPFSRTGTIYYPDGRVQYTGPLKPGFTWDRISTFAFASYTSYLYEQVDDSGNVYDRVIAPRTDPDETHQGVDHHTDTYKDALGRVIKTVFNDGSFTEMLYGVNGAPATGIALPKGLTDDIDEGWRGVPVGGRHEVRIAQRKTGDPVLATHYLYDAQGRLTDVWLPAVADASNGNAVRRPHWHYTYDADGNQTAQTDPNGHTTSFAYDLMGQRISRTLPGGQHESWTYDKFGRMKTHVDFKGQTTLYTYNDTTSGYAGRSLAEYRYNAGRVIDATTMADPDEPTLSADRLFDEKTLYVYDDSAMIINGTPVVPTAERLYLGRLADVQEYVRDASGDSVLTRATHYTYDDITGATASVTQSTGPDRTVESTINHEYYPATGELLRTYTSHNDTVYGYDAQGRLEHVYSVMVGDVRYATFAGLNATTGQPTFSGGTPLTTTYAYDEVGDLHSVSLPNGDTTMYTYDDLNRLTKETITRPDATVQETYDYTLLGNGQRDFVIETRYQADGITAFSTTKVDWDYDDDGRLLSETRDVGNDGQDGEDYVATYAYDLNGNRLSKAFNSANNTKDENISYTYNADDELTAEDSSVDENDATYYYDANGSTLTKTESGQTTRYEWDLRNRMVGVDANNDGDTDDTGDTKYGYDTNGVRISKTLGGADGTATFYVNDDQNPSGYSKVLEEQAVNADGSIGAVTISYVLGHDILGQSRAFQAFVPEYLLKDGHGTTRLLANADGSIGQRYDLDAFQTPLNADALNPATSYLAPDGMNDSETNFTYSLARYRNGFTFISRDSVDNSTAAPLSLHKYLYAGSNPVMNVDPSGHDFTFIGLAMTLSWAADYYTMGLRQVSPWTGVKIGSRGAWSPFSSPPPLLLSLIPIIGPITNAAYHFVNGEPGWGTANIIFAAIDIFGVGAIAGVLGKASEAGITSLANLSGKIYRFSGGVKEEAAVYRELQRLMTLYIENGGKAIKYRTVEEMADAFGKVSPTEKRIFLRTDSDTGTLLHELYHVEHLIKDGNWGKKLFHIGDYEYRVDDALRLLGFQ